MIKQKKGVYIIAEAGVNHNGSVEIAKKMVEKAKEAQVDAIKFQTFITEKEISKKVAMAEYQKKNTGEEITQYEMVKRLELEFENFVEIKNYCDEKEIDFLSTPYDYKSAAFLNDIVNVFKIPSGEITNLPFIEYIARFNKPIILSTGMSYLSEIEKAIGIIKENQNNVELYILHCTSNYPCPMLEVNLKAMNTLGNAFKIPVGYSDHTLGIEIPIAAVALGASIIEKHFTLNRNMAGPDHKASIEPEELKVMVRSIRNIEKALGDGIKKPNESEKRIMDLVRKVIVAKKMLNPGECITKENIEIKRAGKGISPYDLEKILNKRLIKKVEEDEPVTWEHFMR